MKALQPTSLRLQRGAFISLATCLLYLCLALTSPFLSAAHAQAPLPPETTLTTADLIDDIEEDTGDTVAERDAYSNLVTNPISPPDTRSPRATLESFLLIMHTANELWLTSRDEFFDNDNFFLTPEERDNVVLVQALLDKAAQTFDLSQIPAAARDRAGIEIVLQMQEILDRIYLPSLDEIPGIGAGDYDGDESGEGSSLPDKWIIPGTSLTIERQTSGPNAGEYLFTAATVDRIPGDYDVIENLPITSDRGEDLYAYYIYTPGNLIAPQWYQYILNGPEWFHNHYGGQTAWQWIGMALSVTVLMLCIVGYSRWNARRPVPLKPTRRQLRQVIHPVLLIMLANVFRFICEDQINITGHLLQIMVTTTSAVIWTTAAWLTYQVLQLIYLWTSRNPAVTKTSLDASLLRTGFRVASFAVSIIVLGYGATQIGIPIYGVVAGLGVGGLAIALAAQPTLENFIGGLILYTDRLIRVGEFCQFGDLAGTVEEIGIRSTRIRALDRTLISVANADLAKSKIINFSQRDVFLFRHKIGLRYETEAAVLRKTIDDIKSLLETTEGVLESPLRVRLVEYADFSILIDIYSNIAATDLNAFMEIQERLLIEIRNIVETNGAGFAFPSSTVYLTRDEKPQVPPLAAAPSD